MKRDEAIDTRTKPAHVVSLIRRGFLGEQLVHLRLVDSSLQRSGFRQKLGRDVVTPKGSRVHELNEEPRATPVDDAGNLGRINQRGKSLDHFRTSCGRHAPILEDASISQPDAVASPSVVSDAKLRQRGHFHKSRPETADELGEVCFGTLRLNEAVHPPSQCLVGLERRVEQLETGSRES